jgi:hypothetical protein
MDEETFNDEQLKVAMIAAFSRPGVSKFSTMCKILDCDPSYPFAYSRYLCLKEELLYEGCIERVEPFYYRVTIKGLLLYG